MNCFRKLMNNSLTQPCFEIRQGRGQRAGVNDALGWGRAGSWIIMMTCGWGRGACGDVAVLMWHDVCPSVHKQMLLISRTPQEHSKTYRLTNSATCFCTCLVHWRCTFLFGAGLIDFIVIVVIVFVVVVVAHAGHVMFLCSTSSSSFEFSTDSNRNPLPPFHLPPL